MAGTLITDEVMALIGQETTPERNRFPISDEMAWDVADAIQDPNPIYTDPEKAVESARRLNERGWAGTNGNPLEERTWPMDMAVMERTCACIQAVREAVGDDHDILLDAHGSPAPELSIALAKRVAPFRPLFFEEPVKVGSIVA